MRSARAVVLARLGNAPALYRLGVAAAAAARCESGGRRRPHLQQAARAACQPTRASGASVKTRPLPALPSCNLPRAARVQAAGWHRHAATVGAPRFAHLLPPLPRPHRAPAHRRAPSKRAVAIAADPAATAPQHMDSDRARGGRARPVGAAHGRASPCFAPSRARVAVTVSSRIQS